jgi:PAS domain S-box-containing protein
LAPMITLPNPADHRHEICYDNASPHGHYCVPILYAEKTVGVLNLYLNEGTQLSAMEMDYFEAIAAALAGIIQHKRAEEDRERLIRPLRDVLEMVSYSQKQWQDTFDSITDLVSIHDPDFTIIRANQAFAAYFGLTPEEVVNRKCNDFFRDDDPAAPGCPHELAMNENRAVTEEISEAKTGTLFRISTFPYRSPGGDIVGTVRIARDITDEKNNEMRLIMAKRLASLGQMAAGIAHEINNPPASIAGCTEGLLARVRKERYDRQLFENYLGIIVEEISRCKNITSGMLSVIRQSTYEKQDLRPLLHNKVRQRGHRPRPLHSTEDHPES